MILVDTSAWIEFFRRTGSPADLALTGLLQGEADLATSEVIVMELLAGTSDDVARHRLRSRLLSLPVLTLGGLRDFELAAGIYRTCRAGGETPRSFIDCLIAIPAIRAEAEVLHVDRDFDVIARHTSLRIHDVPDR